MYCTCDDERACDNFNCAHNPPDNGSVFLICWNHYYYIPFNGGSGRIRTYGEFPHDSFQDCSDKPDSGTLPKFLVEGLGFEPRLAASKTAILPLDDPSIERPIILTFTVKVKY